MSLRSLALTLAPVAGTAAMLAAGVDDNKGTQTKCPVMGNPINENSFVDYNGLRIFFCCDGCKEKFLADADAYIEKMKASGEEPMRLKPQSVCPVSGEELKSKDSYLDYEGVRVYFCCDNCIAAFEKDPEKYLKVLSDRGEAPEKLEGN